MTATGEDRGGVPIRITRVAKIFGESTDNPFRALKEVTVDVRAGEFMSVVGPSGCGKSTLMLMVAGLLARSSGDIVRLRRTASSGTSTIRKSSV